jgi:hypothetical protein
MERRHFIKVALGFAAGAAALALSAQAAPLPPMGAQPALSPPPGGNAESAVVSQEDVDRLKPEQVRWHHHHWHRHWHRRHWGWHRHHWHRHHWHRHHWHRHHWHRRHW